MTFGISTNGETTGPAGASLLSATGLALTTGQWYQVVASYQYVTNRASVMKLYVNGVLAAQRADAVGPLYAGAGSLWLGSDGANFCRGALDDVRYYTRALTDAEAASLFEPWTLTNGLSYVEFYRQTVTNTPPAAYPYPNVNLSPSERDSDGDGLSDAEEVERYHTDPNSADTIGDGLGDWYRVINGLINPDGTITGHSEWAASADFDGDGVSNLDEQIDGSSPVNTKEAFFGISARSPIEQ